MSDALGTCWEEEEGGRGARRGDNGTAYSWCISQGTVTVHARSAHSLYLYLSPYICIHIHTYIHIYVRAWASSLLSARPPPPPLLLCFSSLPSLMYLWRACPSSLLINGQGREAGAVKEAARRRRSACETKHPPPTAQTLYTPQRTEVKSVEPPCSHVRVLL